MVCASKITTVEFVETRNRKINHSRRLLSSVHRPRGGLGRETPPTVAGECRVRTVAYCNCHTVAVTEEVGLWVWRASR